MTIFYPYILLKTNIKITLLKYNIYIYNTVKNKTETSILFRDTIFKKVGGNIYQTKNIEIDSSKIGIENLRDCVIIFNLYRLSNSGKEALVMNHYIVPDKIESYISQNYTLNKNISITKYNEATSVTKVVSRDDKSKNTIELALSSNRIFQCIDAGCKPGEAKDPFSKAQIEAGLQARLNEPLPNQDQTSLCGPAAYFFCLINLSPSSYKMVVKQLWETGQTKVGELTIRPSVNGCRKVTNFYREDGIPQIPPIDWITLASLRESENIKLLLKNPEQEVAGITTWMEVERWFKQSGFKGCKAFPFYLNGYSPSLIDEINRYAGSDYYVITLISASLLSSGTSSGTQSFPDHWIVWTDKLKDIKGNIINGSRDPYTTEVRLDIFTWGENKQKLGPKISLYDFEKKLFFAMVVKKEKF